LDKISGLTRAFANRYPGSKRFDGITQPFECSDGKLFRENVSEAVFLSVFVLPSVQSGSIISASSGGQRRKPVALKNQTSKRRKKIWDYSIQYSVQLVEKVMALAEQLR
jgi:hypothetical protein